MQENTPSRETSNAVRTLLEAWSESHLAQFSSSLIPGLKRPMLGVRIPKLRQLAKELAAADWASLLDDGGLRDDTFEEVLLRGMVIGYARMPWPEKWARIAAFVPRIDNWAVCDCSCSTYTEAKKHRKELWPALQAYAGSRAEFGQRFAAVMMMSHLLCDEYADDVLASLAAIRPAGYYAAMGIGWALSAAFVKYPEKTLPVLKSPSVSLQSRTLACRKILESRRTPEHWRFPIQALKNSLKNT